MARIDRIDPIAALWRGFRKPWLLLVLGSLALLLILGALIVPQVPPEIGFDVSATNRWLIITSAEYGALGQLMLNIGLFDVIHSLFLRIIFGLIALVLAVHLGHLIGELFFARQIAELPNRATHSVEEPLITSTPGLLFQTRDTVPVPPPAFGDKIEQLLRNTFSEISRTQVTLPVEQDTDEGEPVVQERIFANTALTPRILRPLLMIGLLTALIPLWLIATTGWELYPPPLAPGEQLTYESQGLDLRYVVPSPIMPETANQQTAYPPPRSLEIRLGEETTTLPFPTADANAENDTANSGVTARINQVDIEAYLGPPGLLISTVDGQEGLVLPESAKQMATVGLVFPGVGNEKAVGLPRQKQALRIVRNDNESQIRYLVEVIDSNGNSVGNARQLDGTALTTVDLQLAETSLRFDAVPGVIVEAKYLPGLWFMFLALGLVLIGAIGYWLQTGYVLLQISPWQAERSIVIAQSDKQSEIDAIKALIAESQSDVDDAESDG